MRVCWLTARVGTAFSECLTVWNHAHVRYSQSDDVVLFLKSSFTFWDIFKFILNIPVCICLSIWVFEGSLSKKHPLKFLCLSSLHWWPAVFFFFYSLGASVAKNIYCSVFSEKIQSAKKKIFASQSPYINSSQDTVTMYSRSFYFRMT